MSGPEISGMALDQIRRVSAGMGTYAGTRLVRLEDGVERGQRVVEMRSGGGLSLDVTVDRAGDIGGLSLNGQTLSWHGAGGLRSPWLLSAEEDRGQGFLRGYGGFLNTCGLDHIRQPEEDQTEYTEQEALARTVFPLHGKGAFHPAVLRGHGLIDDASVPVVFCETEFVQAMTFVSALRLRRRIEMPVGGRSIRMHDTVCNIGNGPATHMLMYHFNLGFPLVAEGTSVDPGQSTCIWMSQEHDPLAPFPDARSDAAPVISTFAHGAETGSIQIRNPRTGLGMELRHPATQLPYCQILRMEGAGRYGLGIEPCTTAARSRQAARQAGEMIVLCPGEAREYTLEMTFSASQQQSG